MNQNMKPQFLSLTEDIHVYILTFLLCRDILRCTSVCKDLRQTYLSSSELQYIVELDGQQLLPVDLRVDDHTPISERLRLLRDEAHSWFKFGTRPVQTVIVPEIFCFEDETFVSNGCFCFCYSDGLSGFAKIFSVVPGLSQHKIDHEWSSKSLYSLPNARSIGVLMDPEQNLLAAAYDIIGGSDIYIDLLALDGGGAHPKAAGTTLIVSPELPGRQDAVRYNPDENSRDWRLKSLGGHVALWRQLLPYDALDIEEFPWWVQIWDWKYSTMSDCVLSGTGTSRNLIDFCFLGSNRFLIIMNDNLKVYSIKDLSKAPQLLACFLFPGAEVEFMRCYPPILKNDLAPTTQRTIWTSDPAHRLLPLIICPHALHFVISTSIFFQLDFLEGVATEIPWKNWGPANSRIFDTSGFDVCGSRVLRVIPIVETSNDDEPVECRLHILDFCPSAVKHRQGLGRVVTEPSTVDLDGESVTTLLPYVEVSCTKWFQQAKAVWFDKDRIYILHNDDSDTLEVMAEV
ncbi:hypothetical protein BDR04DRAFT_1108916 [Suillus decipiens]|nr:hypothetical protein BDR04DRAFT_1108916 [Suillus decipiens]